MTISSKLIQLLRKEFVLDWGGIHGAPHWARVKQNGLRLCEFTGANPRVVEAFAFLHDSKRLSDGYDPLHGQRAANFVQSLTASALNLSSDEVNALIKACEGHSCGVMFADVTVRTCWDADRLDLGRGGIRPDPARLCTEAARDPSLINWAFTRSIQSVQSATI
jgi:uncharacterized protein